MMDIGIEVAYAEDGTPDERYFTIRFWRLEFRVALSLQPALDAQKVKCDFLVERDPIADAIAADLQRSLFAARPVTPLDMQENTGLLELLRRSEQGCQK